MQYFFRGQIDAIDAKTTKDTDGKITGMILKVKNTTPGEDIANGKLVVSCQYKKSGDTAYTYSVSDPVTGVSIPTGNDTSTDTYKYTFTFSSPIPADATEPHYMLIYRGKLGMENDAVAGKVFEETPDWSYLLIRQKGFKIKNTYNYSYATNYPMPYDNRASKLLTDTFYEGMITSRNIEVEFELEWAGRMDTITDASIRLNDGTIFPTTIDIVQPTKEKPLGSLKLNISIPIGAVPYLLIGVKTPDNKNLVYLESIIFSKNDQNSRYYGHNWNWEKDVWIESWIPYGFSYIVDGTDNLGATFTVDDVPAYNDSINGCVSERFSRYISYGYSVIWSQGNYYQDTCTSLMVDTPFLLDFFPYTTKNIIVHKKWNPNLLQKFKDSKGADISKFTDWEIPVECWVTN